MNIVQEKKARSPAMSPGRQARGEKRRRIIFRALHDCILEKGYSNTTLADIAEQAGMSPSHLLYYFSGKEGILEQYFATVAQWFLERVTAISAEPVEQQPSLIAELWFAGDTSSNAEIGFMLECFGEAVHDGVMRDTKSLFDQQCKRFLERVFADAPMSGPISQVDAAEIAYSLLIGLRNSVYFDSEVSPVSARRIFLHTIENLKTVNAVSSPET
ncbi:MAG: TetR/AcrR family transcriptional regulator [Congregibacter sp.]